MERRDKVEGKGKENEIFLGKSPYKLCQCFFIQKKKLKS